MLLQKQLANILLTKKVLDETQLTKIIKEAKDKNLSLEEFLINNRILAEPALYKIIAEYYKMPFIDLSTQTIRKDVLFKIPELIAQTHQIIAFDATPKKLKVATIEPKDLEIIEFLQKKMGVTIEIYLTTPSSIEDILKQYRQGLKAEVAAIAEKEIGTDGLASDANLEELAQDLPIIRIVDSILEHAVIEGASDIHIEPTEKEVSVRYRVDGMLRKVMTLPKTAHAGVVARIKILSNLKLDEHRLPQDGRFKISSEKYKISFRVSVIDTFDGEKVVMRLLSDKMQLLSLKDLGFQPNILKIVQQNVKKPNGIILVTGPTGSGKTTTLYAILNVLNDAKVNICTIEDPIEYRMQGINQSQVHPKIGFTFANGLRSLLRQDPDIIMVGEIRDNETAEIAIHSAMTGHLVLSTLHTNSAVASLPRLIDMKIQPFLVAATTNVIIAQRLVRKICPNCRASYQLDEKIIKQIESQIDMATTIKALQKEKAISTKNTSLAKMTFYKGKGCNKCHQEGYKGRVGIYEVLEVTPKISELIVKKASVEEITQVAQEQGMINMMEDGFMKAKQGVTTIEEVLRVTKE